MVGNFCVVYTVPLTIVKIFFPIIFCTLNFHKWVVKGEGELFNCEGEWGVGVVRYKEGCERCGKERERVIRHFTILGECLRWR